MKPGRELDKEVAEKVFGFQVEKRKGPTGRDDYMYKAGEWGFVVVPQYSTHIAAAWDVIEKLKDKYFICGCVEFRQGTWACAGYLNMGRTAYVTCDGVTPSHAICITALQVLKSQTDR